MLVGGVLGSLVGTKLVFPGVGAASVFPPFAVLTAALVLSERRHWLLLLIASTIGNLGPHLATCPIGHVVLCEVANYTKALIAAAGICWFAGLGKDKTACTRIELRSLREMAGLLLSAGVVGPMIGALIGAASAVIFIGATDFVMVWRAWVLSNALTGTTLLPFILAMAAVYRNGLVRRVSIASGVEGAVLSIGLLAISGYLFILPHFTPLEFPAQLYVPIPLLVWAAVRFGPLGASGGLLAMTLLEVIGALSGRDAFALLPETHGLFEFQLYLIITAVPVLLLAAQVAEHRQIADALRMSEANAKRRLGQIEAIYQATPAGLAFVGTNLRYLRVNDQLAELNGLSAEEHIGRTIHEVLPDYAAHFEPIYRRVIATGEPAVVEYEFVFPAKSGTKRNFVASYYPVRDDADFISGVSLVVQDITERKRTEQALRHSEEMYRDVLERQTDLICRFLPDTRLTFVNDAYCCFFRKTRKELLGRPFLELIPPEARAAALDAVDALVRDPHIASHEHAVVLPDGTMGWHEWVDHPILDSTGKVIEFQGVGRDLTARHRAEEAVLKSQAELGESYKEIQALAGRLISAQEDERSRIARELHDGVSQELAALAIHLSFLRQSSMSQAELQEEMGQVGKRASAMAESIRNVSHGLHPGVLRHAGLATALRAHCSEFSQNHNVVVHYRADEGLEEIPQPIALCLYRVAQEALTNIARHAGAQRAWVTLLRDPEGLELLISDDGEGFDASAVRGVSSLGLISLEERVRIAQGKISIDSERGLGTKMRVWVPLPPESRPQEIDHATTDHTAG